jgi:ligand-binding sensor domain-containing protein/DNA-binding CsgD family transcriptional regulator
VKKTTTTSLKKIGLKPSIWILLLIPFFGEGQNTIGLPEIHNYSKIDYKAGLQNWDFKQDKNGIIYVANNEGLLSFDGSFWKLYPLPNKTIVRSVTIGSDNHIYVGGQDELGYFSPGKNGRLVYHSLVDQLPENERNFADVWDIAYYNNEIFFRTSKNIIRYARKKVSIGLAPTNWSFLGEAKGKLYAHDKKTGLFVFENEKWQPLKSNNLTNLEVTSILYIKDALIITTLKNGLYQYGSNGAIKISTPTTQYLENQRIYTATAINNEWIGIGTASSGVMIIDEKGGMIQSLSKLEGLQNYDVLSIFADDQNNLWVGLNNGIDCVGFNKAIKHINPNYQDASAYATVIHKDQLYVGTSSGLYSVPIQGMGDLSFNRGTFNTIANTAGQVWGLANINEQLFLAHHEGAFLVENKKARQINNQQGFWNFQLIPDGLGTNNIVAGNYTGLAYLSATGNSFNSKSIQDYTESSRYVAVNESDYIWVSHPFHGLYKIKKDTSSGNSTPKLYTNKNGLPSILNNHVYTIKDELVVATEKGVYGYNEQMDKFEPHASYQKLLGNQSLRYLKEDKEGNIWFVHEKQLGVVDMSEKAPKIIYISELNNRLLSGFEMVYPVNENNIFVAAENGLININYSKYKKSNYKLHVQIREVRMLGEKDSVLYGGYFGNLNEKQIQPLQTAPKLKKQWGNLHFEFASSLFGLQNNLEYSYRLKGLDKNWSKWSNKTEKEYTNMPAGNYIFEIKVRNNFGEESEIASYEFTILPPWYLSELAYAGYVILFFLIVLTLIRWQKKKFNTQQKKHEEEQKQLNYLKQLEIDKAKNTVTEIKNEKLQLEIDNKNTELLNFTMHLVQKGELLSNLKTHMSKMTKVLENSSGLEELKKMIKVINDAEKMDNDWENFVYHFDKAHNSFTMNLKQKYPKLTANELKLCTFLRLNLSTKEIAQLMNISLRGVELSRYRLRKKLELPTETSLFEFFNSI